jgi:hypothetical protein
MSEPDQLGAARLRRLSLRAWMGTVEAALATPAVTRIAAWRQDVLGALYGLETCLREHTAATEGPAGFHADMVTAAPRLANAVERLAVEHVTMDAALRALLAETSTAASDSDVDGVRDRGTALLTLLSKHRQRGADLIFEAYEADLGGTG